MPASGDLVELLKRISNGSIDAEADVIELVASFRAQLAAAETAIATAEKLARADTETKTELRARLATATKALEFYADPESYHAIAMMGDRPCGDFAEDFNKDEWVKECGYNRPMPGKRAREALRMTKENQ